MSIMGLVRDIKIQDSGKEGMEVETYMDRYKYLQPMVHWLIHIQVQRFYLHEQKQPSMSH